MSKTWMTRSQTFPRSLSRTVKDWTSVARHRWRDSTARRSSSSGSSKFKLPSRLLRQTVMGKTGRWACRSWGFRRTQVPKETPRLLEERGGGNMRLWKLAVQEWGKGARPACDQPAVCPPGCPGRPGLPTRVSPYGRLKADSGEGPLTEELTIEVSRMSGVYRFRRATASISSWSSEAIGETLSSSQAVRSPTDRKRDSLSSTPASRIR